MLLPSKKNANGLYARSHSLLMLVPMAVMQKVQLLASLPFLHLHNEMGLSANSLDSPMLF
jgi:hypothetical protein